MRKQRFIRRRKVCHFCVDKVEDIDYKNVRGLKRYITERGKILPSRIQASTGAQPNLAAAMGPMIGAAPAMEAK